MWVITSPESALPFRIALDEWSTAVALAHHLADERRGLSHGPHPRYRVHKETP